jgi:hypothetical protein
MSMTNCDHPRNVHYTRHHQSKTIKVSEQNIGTRQSVVKHEFTIQKLSKDKIIVPPSKSTQNNKGFRAEYRDKEICDKT